MKCSVQGCEAAVKYAGLCGMHYKRKWRHGDPKITNDPYRNVERIKCIAEESCDNTSDHANGLCDRHYNMQRIYGRTYGIVRRGKPYKDALGYVRMNINGQLMYEHVYLAEKALGKPLPPNAVVHHTKAKDDNHGFCKLVVCPDQAYHMLIHRRMRELGYEGN